MKRIRRRYLWGSLALLLALAAGVYAFSEALLNDLLRPRLVALAAERLAAEVAVGRLSWHQGVLQVDDLQLRRSDHYALQVPRLRLKLGLHDLFERRLSAVAIDSPTLLLQAPSQPGASAGGFPAGPPVTIGRLVLRNGRIDYALAERSLTLRQIGAEISGDAAYRFSLRAQLGGEEPVPLQLAGQADWRQGLQLQLERCEWGGRALLAEPLTLTVPTGDGVAGGGRIRLARFDRAAFEQIRKAFQLPAVLPDEMDFVLRDADFAFRLVEQQWQLGVKLSEGRLQKDKLRLPVDQLDLTLSVTTGGWQGQGTFLLAGGNSGELSASWADGLLQGALALQVAEPGRFKQQLLGGKALEVAGGLRLTTDFSMQQGAVQATFDLQGQSTRRTDKNYLFNLAPLRLQGDLRGPPAELSGQARLLLDGRELLTASGRPASLKLQLRSSAWHQLRRLLGPHLRPAALQELADFSGSAVLEHKTTGSWAVSARLASRRAVLNDLQLDGLSGRLDATGGPNGLWDGSLRLDSRQLSSAGLVLDRLSGNSRLRYQKEQLSFSGLKVTAQLAGPGEFGGRLALTGSGFWQAERWQAHLASLQLQELEWLSADGLAGLGGGRVNLRGQLDGGSGQPLRMDLQADLAATEGLWGACYAELADLPVHLATRLSWGTASRQLLAEHWDLSLGRLGTVQGSGSFDSQTLRLSGELRVPELAGQSTDLLVRLLGESRPDLAEAMFGGGLEVDFDLHKHAGWRLRGELRPQQLGFELPAMDLVLSGLNGRLPFDLAFAGPEPAVGPEPASGELRFEELGLGPARLAAGPLSLVATTNHLALQTPLVLEVAEGRVAVADLLLGRVKEGLLLTGRFTIEGINLQRLTAELGLAPMKGRLDADLGHIHYRGGLLRSEGEAHVDAFGGHLRIRGIGLDISNLSYPQLTADLDLQGIDLYQLTQTFSFGAMNGIVDGHVHDHAARPPLARATGPDHGRPAAGRGTPAALLSPAERSGRAGSRASGTNAP